MRITQHWSIVAAAVLVLAGSASAQTQRRNLPPTGLMLGSTIEDRLTGRDRDRGRNHNPPHWTGGVRLIPGAGYHHGGRPVIIVNNSPCYVPGYYTGSVGYGGYGGYSYGGYGYDSGFSAGLQVGGLSLGYRQSSASYGGSTYYGAAAPYGNYGSGVVREIVREYVAPVDPNAYRGRAAQEEVRPPTGTKPQPENDYYLHRKPAAAAKTPGLADTIRDIETAFRTGSPASLEKHVDRTARIVLQIKGTSRQEMKAEDYLAMTRDALAAMKTARYELNSVQPASNGAMMVTGVHVLRTEDGQLKEFVVGFILKPRGESWIIAEVSAEPK